MGYNGSEKLSSESKLAECRVQGKTDWSRRWRWLELVLLGIGVILLLSYAGLRLRSRISARLAVERFQSTQAGKIDDARNSSPLQVRGEVNFSLWSDKRIQAYRQALLARTDPPLGILRIPKLRLEVPVYAGTDDQTLDLGVGWIDGTARPGQQGNIGLAGHRDGFFRGLKDVGTGDRLEISMADRTASYVVDQVLITNPDDVSVLRPRSNSSLTLVTCYPFYFVGSAPQRYIVQASMADGTLHQNPGGTASTTKPNS